MGKKLGVKKSFKKYASSNKLTKELKTRKIRRTIRHKQEESKDRKIENIKKQAQNEEKEHLTTIKNLSQHDPELHKYLQDTEPDLLNIGRDDDLSDFDEDDRDDDDELVDGPIHPEDVEGEDDADEELKDIPKNIINDERLRFWLRVKRVKHLLTAFHLALDTYTIRENVDEGAEQNTYRYKLERDSMAEEVIIACVKAFPGYLDHWIGRVGKNKDNTQPQSLPKYEKYENQVRAVINGFIRAFRTLNDTQLFTLLSNACLGLVPYFRGFPKNARFVMKELFQLVTDDNEALRVQIFLVIREIAKLPAPFPGLCFKGLFLSMVKKTKTFGRYNLPIVTFLMNSIVVLFGENLNVAYEKAFVFIRQLALYLRKALRDPSPETFNVIQNWQYVNSFRVLAMTVCQYSKPDELYPLIYPLCQIGCGVLEMFPSPKCFPMHLHIIGILNRISKSSGVFVPLSGYLLRILSSPELFRSYPKKIDINPDYSDLLCTLRVKSDQFKQQNYQQAIISDSLYYLVEHLSLSAHSIGFPELAFCCINNLRNIRRKYTSTDWQCQVRDVILEIEKNIEYVQIRRKKVDFGPKDTDKVIMWENDIKSSVPPLVKYYEERKKQRNEDLSNQAKRKIKIKRKTLEDIIGEDSKQKQKQGNKRKLNEEKKLEIPEGYELDDKSSESEDEGGKRGGRRKRRALKNRK